MVEGRRQEVRSGFDRVGRVDAVAEKGRKYG